MSQTSDARRGNGWSRGGFEIPKEVEPEICPSCGNPIGTRPLWMVGKYDICYSCYSNNVVSADTAYNQDEVDLIAEKARQETLDILRWHNEPVEHPNRRSTDDDLGTHVIISGGEIQELGEQKGTDEIPF